MVTKYYAAGIGLKPQTYMRVNEIASCSRIWPIILQQSKEARIARTILASLSDQDLHIAAMPGGARQFFNLDLTLTRKFFELASHANASLSDHVCAPSNGILAAVYDSIGPAIVAHERQ